MLGDRTIGLCEAVQQRKDGKPTVGGTFEVHRRKLRRRLRQIVLM
jgi:hypothetical protein